MTMAREPMNQNQKFALLVFAIVVLGAVVVVWMNVNAGINSML
jgi:hypothetical protein